MNATISHAVDRFDNRSAEYLPESDGRPMAETDRHRQLMLELLHAVEEHFRSDPDVYVSGNIFLHYLDEMKTRRSVSPDIMVVRGVEKKDRRIYKLEEEGKAPEVVIELTSSNTKLEDLGNKRALYEMLCVREYFLFDPYNEALQPSLRGYRLEQGEFLAMVGSRLYSETLGLELHLEDGHLRLYDRKLGERLRTPSETEAKLRQESQARRVAEHKAETESQARQAAEAEVSRLREQLARLQSSKP